MRFLDDPLLLAAAAVHTGTRVRARLARREITESVVFDRVPLVVEQCDIPLHRN